MELGRAAASARIGDEPLSARGRARPGRGAPRRRIQSNRLAAERPRGAARSTFERIRRTVAERSFAEQGLPPARRISVSIGVVERRGAETLGDLLKRADEALYAAKTHGRNQVVAAD